MNFLKKIVDTTEDMYFITENEALNIIQKLRNITKEYVEKNNLKSLVIGISGGLDSAVTAAICQEKYTGVPLIGLSIPMNSKEEHKERATYVGKNFCSYFEEYNEWDLPKELNFNIIYENLYKNSNIANKLNFNDFNEKISVGNLKARLRMITLYDLARKTNGLVLSTDNLSELLMGFWTICGDVGDLGLIQNIYKGVELPYIAKALNIREDVINQDPSDGLNVTEQNTDEAQLGANYKEIDTIMIKYLQNNNFFEENKENFTEEELIKINRIINQYLKTSFKRNGCFNVSREEIFINN